MEREIERKKEKYRKKGREKDSTVTATHFIFISSLTNLCGGHRQLHHQPHQQQPHRGQIHTIQQQFTAVDYSAAVCCVAPTCILLHSLQPGERERERERVLCVCVYIILVTRRSTHKQTLYLSSFLVCTLFLAQLLLPNIGDMLHIWNKFIATNLKSCWQAIAAVKSYY